MLADGSDDYTAMLAKQSLTARAIAATAHVRAMLGYGFTTIRDVETEGAMYADADLAAAIDNGVVVGPRLFASTRGLAPTGAGADSIEHGFGITPCSIGSARFRKPHRSSRPTKPP